MGLTAYISLGTGKIEIVASDTRRQTRFIGSRGLAASFLYENVGKGIDPLSPDNLLVFSTGPLTGTPWPTSARYTVTAKSPATGAYGYANSSGFFGPELKKAGFDNLIFGGRSPRPVYLLVEEGKVSIEDAAEFWGQTTDQVEEVLRRHYPGSRVASIGPAGENLVTFAAIINDYGRAAARTGMGAVMGSKRLKAVVARGSQRVQIPPAFLELVKRAVYKVKSDPETSFLTRWGTSMLIEPKNAKGDLPSKNHRWGQFPGGSRIDARALDQYVLHNQGCFACPIRCSRISRVAAGPYRVETEGPEYETLNALGANVWNDNLPLIIYANKLCNQLGLDTISTGMAISFAMEAHEAGLLQDPELNLKWGDPATITGLIERIAYRQGTGDLLAQGVRVAAERLGEAARRFAMEVKGVEIPRQEPRVAKAFGLGHATSNRGADHLYALPTIDIAGLVHVAERLFPNRLPGIMDLTSEEHKAAMVHFTEAYNAIVDSVGVCKFSTTETYALYPEDLAEALTALGHSYSAAELLRAGERIVNLERMYNVRHGFTARDDRLPDRFLREPLAVYADPRDVERAVPIGKKEGHPPELLKEGLTIDLDRMLREYYQLRGWTPEGIPTPEKLRELGLDELVPDLPGEGASAGSRGFKSR